MSAKKRSERRSPGGNLPPNDHRRPEMRGRPAGAPSGRALARAGTRGSDGDGRGSLMLWSAAFVVIAALVVGITLLVTQSGGNAAAAPVAPSVVTPASIPSQGRTLGDSNAPVTVDLYGDFRCSACFDFATGGTEASLVENYIATGKVKLVWHDYLSIDIIQGNSVSRDAANAAWCAADQGKFWVMHDWLYANDEAPTESASAFSLTRLAAIGKAAGLDMSTFQTCLDKGTHDADVAAEMKATPSDVTGTPTILVDGTLVTGGQANTWPQYPQLKAAIDAVS